MPFADYKNFADCVAKNKGKTGDPKAYCASIARKVLGKEHLADKASAGKRKSKHQAMMDKAKRES